MFASLFITVAMSGVQCMPVELWSASPKDLPCHRIGKVYEDGSANLRLGTASKALANCTIPDVVEEKSTFKITCTKR